MPKEKKTCGFCKYWEDGQCMLLDPTDTDGDLHFTHSPKKEIKSILKKKKMAQIETNILTGDNGDDLTEQELNDKKDVRIYPSLMTNENFGCNLFEKKTTKLN